MKVESIVLGSIGTNCYIVTNEETKECFAVDMAECPQEYVNYIKNNGLEMKALFLTHGHFDHIMGIDDFLKAFPVPVYAGEDELPVIEDDRLNVSCIFYVRTEIRIPRSKAGERRPGDRMCRNQN